MAPATASAVVRKAAARLDRSAATRLDRSAATRLDRSTAHLRGRRPRVGVVGGCRALRAMVVLLVALGAAQEPARGQGRGIEVGGYVGYHQPLDQDDASDDITWGARARMPVVGDLRIEPAVTYFSMDRGPYRVSNVIQEVRTWHITGLTLSLTYGRGFGLRGYHPYVTAGAGVYFLRKRESPDADRPGLRAGAGLMIGMKPNISVDLSATAVRISLQQGGARGIIDLSAGFSYHFGVE